MDGINSNLLHASVGHFVNAQSPLTEWPTEVPAFYSEVAAQDLREGMEGIVHVLDSIPKTLGRYASQVINEMGTITSVEYKDSDPDNLFVAISHRLPSDIDSNNAARQYSTYMNTTNWLQNGKFYQRHVWHRLHPDTIAGMPHEGVKDVTLRIDHWDGETVMSIVMDSVKPDTWENIKQKFAVDINASAIYHLWPKPVKVLRQAEAIPPMPGEKPAQPQPADDAGSGEAGDNVPDIPPMPGSGNQSTDPNKRGETTELGEGWWGTGRGD